MNRNNTRLTLLSLFLAPALATAGETTAAAPAAVKEESAFDRLWSMADLYKNKENPIIQKLSFTGRAQIDLFHVDSDLGDADDWNFRRLRLGAKAKLFNDFTLHAEIDADGNGDDDFYQRLTDAYIAWQPDPMLKLTLGKHGMPFTADGATSSKELITIDRSNLTNNLWFPDEYLPGVSISGEDKTWNYHLGVYSTGTETPEFGDLDASWTMLASLGRRLGPVLGGDDAGVRVDYVYQDPSDDTETFTRLHEHVGSLVFDWNKGPWDLVADVSASQGYGSQSDLFGFQVMPSVYLIEDKLQAVLRYTYLSSSDGAGVRYARYDSEVTSVRGDEYQELYAGLNYYIYGHKLKVQGGVQYAGMNGTPSEGDVESWQATLGLRLSW